MARLAMALVLVVFCGAAWPGEDNDATCPVVAGEEDLVELWVATGFSRFDMNGPVTDCAGALQNPLLFVGNGIPDVVEMAFVQAAVEADTPLGATTARAIYEESAGAFCGDISTLFSETGAAFAMMSPDSQSLVQCAVLGYSASFANPPIWINMSDNPAAGFVYFGRSGDFDGDDMNNLDEWISALATVGIFSTDVLTYDDTAWGMVWENAKRGGPGGATALEAFLAGNGLSLPQSVDFFPLPGAVAAPPGPFAGELRLVSWNLEFFNTRTPARTPEQLEKLAARLASFKGAVYCLQEIIDKPVLDQVMDLMGPSYKGIYWDSQDAIVYDENKVTLEESGLLSFLTAPPYSTYASDYPGATEFPFAPPGRVPVTAVFRQKNGTELFRVISFHGHWASEICRQYEGNALHQYVENLLNTDIETSRIFILGDYNGWPGCSPNLEMEDGVVLSDVPSENGGVTHVSTVPRIDHVSATEAGLELILDGSLYVVRPRLYGETGAEFQATYSDHLPLLVEIQPEAQMPVKWWAMFGAVILVGAIVVKVRAMRLKGCRL